MTFDAEKIYAELRPHFQERVRRNEPLARHCTFGVGGSAEVWVSLDTSRELVDLVTLSTERQCPLLLVGIGTNILYADAGVRGIVARIPFNKYLLEDHGDGTALLLASAGGSCARPFNDPPALASS